MFCSGGGGGGCSSGGGGGIIGGGWTSRVRCDCGYVVGLSILYQVHIVIDVCKMCC